MSSFIDLHTHATAGHVTSFAWSQNTSDRSLAWSHHTYIHVSTRSIAIEVKHETLPANRARLLDRTSALQSALHWKTRAKDNAPQGVGWNCAAGTRPTWNTLKHCDTVDRDCSIALHCTSSLLACSSRSTCRRSTRNGHYSRLSSMHLLVDLVLTGHNARRPRTGREREPWWRLCEASCLTVWTLNDRFFASLVYCMLKRVLSEYWRKETEKSKFFRRVVGLVGPCSAQAEQRKKPVAVGPLPGAYLSTETNLVPIRGVMRKEFETGHTRTQTDTQTQIHTELKRRGPPGPRR